MTTNNYKRIAMFARDSELMPWDFITSGFVVGETENYYEFRVPIRKKLFSRKTVFHHGFWLKNGTYRKAEIIQEQ